MPITYLDEEPRKVKITYLDEEQETPIGKMKQYMETHPETKKAAIVMSSLAKSPIGFLALRMAGKSPQEIKSVLDEFTPQAKIGEEKLLKGSTDLLSSLVAITPIMRGVGALPLFSKLYPTLKMATGIGAYSAAKAGIEGEKPGSILSSFLGGAGTGLLTAGLMKGGATLVPKQIPGAERIGSAIGGYAAGKMMGNEKDAALFGALGAVFPMQRANLQKVGISRIRDYAANKVNAIRRGFWDNYAPQEWKAYEQGIENIPKSGVKMVQGADVVQNLEQTLSRKGLMAPDGTLQKGFTPADNKLIKAYQNISRKWSESPTGELDIKDVIDEWRNIRGKYTGKPTPVQRQYIDAANDFFNTITDQINTQEFTKVKFRYKQFKDNQQLIHEAIDLYGPEMKTAKGERWLTEGAIRTTTQGRKTAEMIKETTKQELEGAKWYSRRKIINPLSYIRR